jgi:hypothetical protein
MTGRKPFIFETSTFKNSHYNTAHYSNPNFHPEERLLDAEDRESKGRMTNKNQRLNEQRSLVGRAG